MLFYLVRSYKMGHAVAQLRHCATSQKVAGSIPDSVIGIFHWHNPSDRTMALGSNGNEYQGYFLGGKGGRYVGLTTLPSSCADCLEIWKPHPHGTLRACPALYRDCFTFSTLPWCTATQEFKGLSSHVQGLLYLFNFTMMYSNPRICNFDTENCYQHGAAVLWWNLKLLNWEPLIQHTFIVIMVNLKYSRIYKHNYKVTPGILCHTRLS